MSTNIVFIFSENTPKSRLSMNIVYITVNDFKLYIYWHYDSLNRAVVEHGIHVKLDKCAGSYLTFLYTGTITQVEYGLKVSHTEQAADLKLLLLFEKCNITCFYK